MTNIILNISDLGRALRNERKALGLTQRELAKRAGLTRQTIINMEGGDEFNASTLLRTLSAMSKRIEITDKRPELEKAQNFFRGSE